ncbi:MAG: hypothetical protein JXA81_14220 [Sedimentisphaerales bacterium]|nr:hypothetical protein [Sedimentisphaerales bacterium]
MTSNNNVLARFIIYTLSVFGFTASLPIIIEYGDIVIFSENGIIEWIQFILVMLTASTLLLSAKKSVYGSRELLYILSLVALFAAIRELDKTLDKSFPILGWSLPAFLCAVAAGLIYWKNQDAVIVQMNTFMDTRAFSLLWCGFIVAVPFAQLVGHGAFLKLLMGDDYISNYKRVIEELSELLGYLLIFIGSVETLLQQKEKDRSNVVKEMA